MTAPNGSSTCGSHLGARWNVPYRPRETNLLGFTADTVSTSSSAASGPGFTLPNGAVRFRASPRQETAPPVRGESADERA